MHGSGGNPKDVSGKEVEIICACKEKSGGMLGKEGEGNEVQERRERRGDG